MPSFSCASRFVGRIFSETLNCHKVDGAVSCQTCVVRTRRYAPMLPIYNQVTINNCWPEFCFHVHLLRACCRFKQISASSLKVGIVSPRHVKRMCVLHCLVPTPFNTPTWNQTRNNTTPQPSYAKSIFTQFTSRSCIATCRKPVGNQAFHG